ncbi:histidine phosphatase family protein [Fundicoccus culcitae]|uniref:Histidine phosphatase family protein n=1 Tax=Fundicoccus culcitae TaxID=2969821 RepID=A0ABY5P5S7_9LACT|nr:histidine phosphatase family protein [Fundicoccus culcitae]UUX34062.1 histidine phosphatase family protein [Fundicoccus culcitae]
MTKGVTFYFVRHGETYLNFMERVQGWANAPLTDRGEVDVHRSGMGLADVEFDAVYSSDLMRTIDTAEIILSENNYADDLTIVPMKAFREVHFGYYEGLPSKVLWDQIDEYVTKQHDLPAGDRHKIQFFMNTVSELDPYNNAENYADFWTRVEAGLIELLQRHAATDKNILVVSHGMTIRNLLEGLVADFSETEPLKNASVTIVKYIEGHFELLAYNQVDHFAEIADDASVDPDEK